MYRELKECRLCSGHEMDLIFDLGMQSLTGIFLKSTGGEVPAAPLQLKKCRACDLVQLGHSFDSNQLFGMTYGYRSGLNGSMVRHLEAKVKKLLARFPLKSGDLVLDIGSNDGTLLRSYPEGSNFQRIGIDPTGVRFKDYYPPQIQLIPDFFSSFLFKKAIPEKRAGIVTSIAMFYDLDDPLGFAMEVEDIMAPNGVWHFEQSYLPSLLETTSYDTICHEHLEYYALKQIKQIVDQAGLKIVDLEFNEANGGSFAVTAAKVDSEYAECTTLIQRTLEKEEILKLSSLDTYRAFVERVELHRSKLREFFLGLKKEGKSVLGYGASTKGNVLLQYCGLTREDLPFIAEVNEDKFGAFTPGSDIPIISEADAKAMNPDYFLVLPWHFRSSILEREKEFLKGGGSFVFPLPRLEIVAH